MNSKNKVPTTKKSYMFCSCCGREFKGCTIRLCPNTDEQFKFECIYGRFICMYCCKKCEENYPEGTGQKCKLVDSIKESELKNEKG